jgi:cell division protein FtsN
MLTESLGEPRRVRTVSVKPDTPVRNPVAQNGASTQAAATPAPQSAPHRDSAENRAPVSPIPTMMMPDGSDAGSNATASQASQRPSRTLASNPPPVRTADASDETPIAPAATPPAKAPQRVASVSPETTASTADTPAPSARAVTTSSGGYVVQIGVRSSEADAHTAFRQMQSKFHQLSGKPELIRQADVNGKSIYRVRVGPLAKAEATSLCTELKGAGGQCFVAKD